MDDKETTNRKIPQGRIVRALATWADAHPDEVVGAIREHLRECETKRNELKALDGELPSLPDEPKLARHCRVAWEIGHTEPKAKAFLARHWKIKGKKLDTRYKEAFQAHMEHDRFRRERNAEWRKKVEEIDAPNGVSIAERVLRLVAHHDAFVEEDKARAALLELHLLAGRLKLNEDPFAATHLAVDGAGRGVKAVRRYIKVKGVSMLEEDWKKVREHFGLDEHGRKIGQGKAAKGKGKRGAKPRRDARKDKRIYDARKDRKMSCPDLAREFFGDETKTREVAKAIDSHRQKLRRQGKK